MFPKSEESRAKNCSTDFGVIRMVQSIVDPFFIRFNLPKEWLFAVLAELFSQRSQL